MSTTTDEDRGLDAHVRKINDRSEELLKGLMEKPAMLGEAVDYFVDLVMYTRLHLHDPDRHPDTAAPGEVVAFIDELARVLHAVRAEAVTENRRRLDDAMERSAKLLGIEDEGGAR